MIDFPFMPDLVGELERLNKERLSEARKPDAQEQLRRYGVPIAPKSKQE